MKPIVPNINVSTHKIANFKRFDSLSIKINVELVMKLKISKLRLMIG